MLTRIVMTGLLVSASLTIVASPGWAGCMNPPLDEKAISEFKANPKALISADADTRTVEATVRDLAGTDAALAADLVRVASGTSPRFQTAIAAGLAQAAMACSSVDQKSADLIQEAVAGYDDGQFQASFAAVAGDLSTAATAAASASADSSVGSVIITNPNKASAPPPQFGGGGTLTPVQISSSAIALNPTPTTIPSTATTPSAEKTAAQPVSQTR
jgi:hypothetical protein